MGDPMLDVPEEVEIAMYVAIPDTDPAGDPVVWFRALLDLGEAQAILDQVPEEWTPARVPEPLATLLQGLTVYWCGDGLSALALLARAFGALDGGHGLPADPPAEWLAAWSYVAAMEPREDGLVVVLAGE